LVLLSLYQTCRYKGVSFLRFLLSGEQDIDAFVQARRRRRATARRPAPSRQRGDEPADRAEQAAAGEAPGGPGARVSAEAIIEEVSSKVVAGEDDPRLRWGPGGKRVRVLVEAAFPDRGVRGPALHRALEQHLKTAGWVWAHGRGLHTYERAGAVEGGQGLVG